MQVLLPVKRFDRAKRRLSTLLDEGQRSRLASLLLQDVLDTLRSSPAISGIFLVGSDPELVPLAGEEKIRLLPLTCDGGHAADLDRALELLPRCNGEPVLILPADVPQLCTAELAMLADAPVQGIVLCPAIRDGGTNALLFRRPLPIPLLFGEGSFSRHQQAARQRGVRVRVLELPGLGRDIDRPEDLQWLARQPTGGRSWRYVRRLLEQHPAASPLVQP